MKCTLIEKTIIEFIKTNILNAGRKCAIIGLSGGIDSSLLACLAVKALGNGNVYGLHLYYQSSGSQENSRDAEEIGNLLNINFKMIDITEFVNKYIQNNPDMNLVRRGNMVARHRMSILYDHAALYNALVLGTTNKTELYLGYFTKYGDGGVDLRPISNLYKKDIRELAKFIGLPKKIIKKKPSAEFWIGQTDESELGLNYYEADEILRLYIDKNLSINEIVDLGYNLFNVEKVISLIKISEHKRMMPEIC